MKIETEFENKKIIPQPADKGTRWFTTIERIRDRLPSLDGKAGKYLKVSGDEGHCEWVTGGGGGTGDYNELDNKPTINSVTLAGNKTLTDLGIQQELDKKQKKVFYQETEPLDAVPGDLWVTDGSEGGSVEIDGISIRKNDDDELCTGIGGGIETSQTEEVIVESTDGTFIPAGTLPEVPVDVVSFSDSADLLDNWEFGTHLKFTLKLGGYASLFDATISRITVLGVTLVGFETTDDIFGAIKFGHIYPSGAPDTIAVIAENHLIPEVTYQMLAVKLIGEEEVVHQIGGKFVPIDDRVMELTENEPKKITLKERYGTWDEEQTTTYANASTLVSHTASAITTNLSFISGKSAENLRGKQFLVQYDGQFADTGDKFGGFITGRFKDEYPNDIVADIITDTGEAFTGGSLRIPITAPNTMVMTEGTPTKHDFSRNFSWNIIVKVVEKVSTVHTIDKDYIVIDGGNFEKQSTGNAGQVWGITADGSTGLLPARKLAKFESSRPSWSSGFAVTNLVDSDGKSLLSHYAEIVEGYCICTDINLQLSSGFSMCRISTYAFQYNGNDGLIYCRFPFYDSSSNKWRTLTITLSKDSGHVRAALAVTD